MLVSLPLKYEWFNPHKMLLMHAPKLSDPTFHQASLEERSWMSFLRSWNRKKKKKKSPELLTQSFGRYAQMSFLFFKFQPCGKMCYFVTIAHRTFNTEIQLTWLLMHYQNLNWYKTKTILFQWLCLYSKTSKVNHIIIVSL